MNGPCAEPRVQILIKYARHADTRRSEDTKIMPTSAINCLIVDDEPQLRKVLVHVMEEDGFHCFEAGNGFEALDLLDREPVTLVMSDMRMPRMDGIELLKQMRTRWPDVAVVMITAVSDVDVGVKCLSMGAMDYLTKPFHMEEVRARVRQTLEKRRLILENREYQRNLENRVAVQARRLEEVFLAGIQALAEALEVKDPYTRGHSVRVSQYSAAIARALDLNSEMIRQIALGGHLHDIGKIGVRESVLAKTERLTDEEYQHVMTHPVVGWKILAPLLSESPIALNVVRSHHERVDGAGVPDGLRGNQIPLEARIVAVADALDAMTSGRPYRDMEMSFEFAIKELSDNCGRQFDRQVVTAMLKAVNDGSLRLIPRSAELQVPVSV